MRLWNCAHTWLMIGCLGGHCPFNWFLFWGWDCEETAHPGVGDEVLEPTIFCVWHTKLVEQLKYMEAMRVVLLAYTFQVVAAGFIGTIFYFEYCKFSYTDKSYCIKTITRSFLFSIVKAIIPVMEKFSHIFGTTWAAVSTSQKCHSRSLMVNLLCRCDPDAIDPCEGENLYNFWHPFRQYVVTRGSLHTLSLNTTTRSLMSTFSVPWKAKSSQLLFTIAFVGSHCFTSQSIAHSKNLRPRLPSTDGLAFDLQVLFLAVLMISIQMEQGIVRLQLRKFNCSQTLLFGSKVDFVTITMIRGSQGQHCHSGQRSSQFMRYSLGYKL